MLAHITAQDLRVSILTNQFTILLQPKVCLKSFQTIGYEALLRWSHPTYGLLPTNQWISIIEESGLITELTGWLIEQVAEALSYTDTPLPIAVNISPASITVPFAEKILSIFRYYNVPANLITLELTESQEVTDYSLITEGLNILRQQGIKISLDDFGTGYNSMQTLLKLPVDEIKIDKGLVQSDHPNSPLILSALANIAQGINLTIVCEGIENNIHLNRALKINAEVGQGYLFIILCHI
jgi:EAL domain-containing protein (putative c-di-GMP-specific phosphodiesterase class I)